MNTTKAQQVEAAYDDAAWDISSSSKGCYALAINAAIALGGIEIDTRNITESCTSKVTFEFDDLSSVQVTYGGVFVIC